MSTSFPNLHLVVPEDTASAPWARAPNETSEPIHPATEAVQSHGVLLVCRLPDLVVLQASANASTLFGRDVALLLGRPLDELDGMRALASRPLPSAELLAAKSAVDVVVSGSPCEAILHRRGARLIVELEPVSPTGWTRGHPLARLQHALVGLRGAASVDVLLETASRELRAATGFERVTVQRVEPDGHVVVVAEARHDELAPYLGLHLAEHDAPVPARGVDAEGSVRWIPDLGAAPAALVPALDPETRAPADLGAAVLRAPPPADVERIARDGTRASLTVSLAPGGRPFGIIACQHRAPKLLSYEVRVACEIVAEVVAGQLAVFEARDRASRRARASRALTAVLDRIARQGVTSGLLAGARDLLELVDADGVALVSDGTVSTSGRTPDVAHVQELARFVVGARRGGLMHTSRLASVFPAGRAIADVASGVLAVTVPSDVEHVLVWFRSEAPRLERWAGDPRRAATRDGVRFHPRAAFAEWTETSHGSARPWTEAEIESARALRAAILDVVVTEAAQLARRNDELREEVRVRDEFFSMASHELRTPLATLELQLDLLAQLAESSPDVALGSERVLRSLAMERRQLTRLEELVAEMLDVSRLSGGRLEIVPQEGVHLCQLVREVLARFAADLAKTPVDVRASGDLVGCWDRSRLDQVVTNLLSNALKYGAGHPVTIELRGQGEVVTLAVRDRGVGLDASERDALFTRFRRAPSNARRFAGSGIGLWIVKQLVVAHGGHVHVESEIGRGATFVVCLPRRASRARIGAS